jgi:hypothetical protein
MMRAAVMACVLALTGCASAPEQKVVTVQVKVKEPCIDKVPRRPVYQTGKGDYPGDAAAAQALAADFERAEQYGVQWEAAAAGCLVIKPNGAAP